jgi:uncharacterized protein (TIGR00297 family)
MAEKRRQIPVRRERMQSAWLTAGVSVLLAMKLATAVWEMHRLGMWPPYPRWLWVSLTVSAGFALLVWLLRSATGAAAALGGLICMNLLLGQARGTGWQQTAMPALLTLFVLTFAATRFGRARKERMGVAEAGGGRRAASQIIANLGVAGLCAGLCAGAASPMLFAACVAALAEATADTISSELGQALSGRTVLITSWREAPAGTDGGISLAGTVWGAAAAGMIVLVTAATGALTIEMGMVAFAAAVLGLLFDSMLGATVERSGWMGNDLVNFCSTAFAAVVACAGMWR